MSDNKSKILAKVFATCNDLVQSVAIKMQPFLDRQQATMEIKIATGLPLLSIDPVQIRRVYENLIANALEYNQLGLHLTLEIKIRDRLHDKQSAITGNPWIYSTLSDDGIGISPQLHPQLFDLYTRATSNKQSLNIGLGLYICRQIITAHGGEIGINDIEKGASFWFTLPVTKNVNNLSKPRQLK